MTILAFGDHLRGPFISVAVRQDGLICDDEVWPFSVTGPYALVKAEPPVPLRDYRWDAEAEIYVAKSTTPSPLTGVAAGAKTWRTIAARALGWSGAPVKSAR